jgi:hypothetical protein
MPAYPTGRATAARLRHGESELNHGVTDLEAKSSFVGRFDDFRLACLQVFASPAHQALVGERGQRIVIERGQSVAQPG